MNLVDIYGLLHVFVLLGIVSLWYSRIRSASS